MKTYELFFCSISLDCLVLFILFILEFEFHGCFCFLHKMILYFIFCFLKRFLIDFSVMLSLFRIIIAYVCFLFLFGKILFILGMKLFKIIYLIIMKLFKIIYYLILIFILFFLYFNLSLGQLSVFLKSFISY